MLFANSTTRLLIADQPQHRQMLLFGHVGLTTAAAFLAQRAITRGQSRPEAAKKTLPSTAKASATIIVGLDYRVLAVASLLPDIIDKPLGLVILRSSLGNSRIFSHTLLFTMLLACLGFWLRRKRGSLIVLAVAFGSLAHIIFDRMWNTPATLFWPLLGLKFPREDPSGWLPNIFGSLTRPIVFIPETAGFAFCCFLIIRALFKKQFTTLLTQGKLP